MIPAIQPDEIVTVNKLAGPIPNPLHYLPSQKWKIGPPNVRLNAIKRNDILLFLTGNDPYGKSTLIKRCVGMPGDTVSYYSGHIEIQDRKYPLTGHQIPTSPVVTPPLLRFIIPARGDTLRLDPERQNYWGQLLTKAGREFTVDEQGAIIMKGKTSKYWINDRNWYFLVGDNHADSFDSRVLGLIPESAVIGRARSAVWPLPSRTLR